MINKLLSVFFFVSLTCSANCHAEIKIKKENFILEGNENPDFFMQLWYKNKIDGDAFISPDDKKSIVLIDGVDISTVTTDGRPGGIPLISGGKDFFVEVCYRIDGGDEFSFPAIWMLPVEHNKKRQARWDNDPVGFERYVEIDIDEGGFVPGPTGTIHYWSGIWPKFEKISNPGNKSKFYLDRSKNNCFSVNFHAKDGLFEWMLNGEVWNHYLNKDLPDVMKKQNYFLIISHQKHSGFGKNYKMIVSKVIIEQR